MESRQNIVPEPLQPNADSICKGKITFHKFLEGEERGGSCCFQ
jgi:hypothetical protein